MGDFFTNAVPIITALTGLLGVLLGFVGIILTFFISKRTLNIQILDEERKSIYKKINTFYGPFRQLRGVNYELYKVFRARRGEILVHFLPFYEGKSLKEMIRHFSTISLTTLRN